ncbi:MAG TPA: hypothetical protein VHV10_14765, partial [Ktedonobacteraceae bacterium]|nr:hypothetical protein [Ktedonobacteraceae bacterium]
YVRACGGGYLPHRWSQEKRYDNPSVYCADLKEIFSHIWEHIAPDLHLVTEEGRVRLLDLLNKETS